jgi:hypothetical protein
MVKKSISSYLSEIGQRGGTAGRGKSKVRGGRAYYQRIAAASAKVRSANAKLLRPHPLLANFPLYTIEQYAALKASIATDGQLVPIVLYKGRILDGRHRYRACLDLGIEPKFEEYTGDAPVSRMLALNARQGPTKIEMWSSIAKLRAEGVITAAEHADLYKAVRSFY